MLIPSLPFVPIDLHKDEKEFLHSLEGKVDNILVAGRKDNKLYVMGNKGGSLYFPHGYEYLNSFNVREYVTIDRETTTGNVEVSSFQGPDYKTWKDMTAAVATVGLSIAYFECSAAQRERKNLRDRFHSRAMRLRESNLNDIAEKIKDIRLYQGTLEEVQQDIGKPLERVDTGKPETYLQKDDPFWLRVEAYLLGANAVVHYQPGSAIGTPVRFKDK